jgi:hypothetical protein
MLVGAQARHQTQKAGSLPTYRSRQCINVVNAAQPVGELAKMCLEREPRDATGIAEGPRAAAVAPFASELADHVVDQG